MDVFLPIAQVFVNPIEILLLSAIVGVLSGLFGVGGGFFVMQPEFLNYIKNDQTFLEREPMELLTKKTISCF